MPLGAVARQPRHLQAQHQAGAPQADFGYEFLKTIAIGGESAGLSEVAVDHHDLFGGPPPSDEPPALPVPVAPEEC